MARRKVYIVEAMLYPGTPQEVLVDLSIKATKKAAVMYGEWLLTKGHTGVCISERQYVKTSDVEYTDDKKFARLFDEAWRSVGYMAPGDKEWEKIKKQLW